MFTNHITIFEESFQENNFKIETCALHHWNCYIGRSPHGVTLKAGHLTLSNLLWIFVIVTLKICYMSQNT